ncbi:MAG: aconitate hydratase AcnA [Ardenticatenales bacterium]
MSNRDAFGARAVLATADGPVAYYRLAALAEHGLADLDRLPFSIKVLLEAALRNLDDFAVTEAHVKAIAGWRPDVASDEEVPFVPARVILQDFTGVPAVVDLAAMRDAIARLGGDPQRINPRVPVDLVIDHSVQVDAFGSLEALLINADLEFDRNRERYAFLRWGRQAFERFEVVPPASGIVHQVNLEYLATVVQRQETDDGAIAYPDSLVGTDSHTTMINGLGVLGWGVGGIEAEAVMLGQPLYMVLPGVVGFELVGSLPEGATATDLVLRVTEMLRAHGVVGKFVEYFGDGLSRLSLPDRATLANMAPEYGATCGFFPVDDESIEFLRRTNRGASADLVERYAKAQGLYRRDGMPAPAFSSTLRLDMATITPSLAGPKRPQDRVDLSGAKRAFWSAMSTTYGRTAKARDGASDAVGRWLDEGGATVSSERRTERADLFEDARAALQVGEGSCWLSHGSVVIAAITSCTNTSNPSVMVAAGLVAKKAIEHGLARRPWVKTSMAPGSKVVTRYLDAAGLTPYLEGLGFHTVGYGCTSCIGNSGPLPAPVEAAIKANDLVAVAVLSGNRNFEGRVHPLTRANYLASPPLVVAYAIAGTMDIDFGTEPIGFDPTGAPVYLAELWPSQAEIADVVRRSLTPAMFAEEYGHIYDGNPHWNAVPVGSGDRYAWDPASTYIREPSFFQGITPDAPPIAQIEGARVLALLGDSITTDHISPAGSIPAASPAGRYLMDWDIEPRDFNSYGSRRGNHEVMVRGTFANIRLRNQLAPGTEGGWTKHVPSGDVTSIYEASERYQADGVPLVILAGAEYGTGSSRDWAAKGTLLLGVKAVIAKSYERIHRSNLVGMGVLPLQFDAGEGWAELGLSGDEAYDVPVPAELTPGQRITVTAVRADGTQSRFTVTARLDSPVDVRYWRNGGILQAVLRDMLRSERVSA